MTLSKVVGDLQRLGIKRHLKLNHMDQKTFTVCSYWRLLPRKGITPIKLQRIWESNAKILLQDGPASRVMNAGEMPS